LELHENLPFRKKYFTFGRKICLIRGLLCFSSDIGNNGKGTVKKFRVAIVNFMKIDAMKIVA